MADVADYFKQLLQQPLHDYWGPPSVYHNEKIDIPKSRVDAIQHALELASSDPSFEQCVDNIFTREDVNFIPLVGPVWGYVIKPRFTQGSCQNLLAWKPSPWIMPTEEELLSLESLLSDKVCDREDSLLKVCRDTNSFFLAAALAANFLQVMDPKHRKDIRRIILEEQHHAVSHPELHLQALAPFLQENAKLHIISQNGLWTNSLPAGMDSISSNLPVYRNKKILVVHVLVPIIEWMHEATKLSAHTSQLFINLDIGISFNIWNAVVQAASMQENMLECLRTRRIPVPPAESSENFPSCYGPLPCHLPRNFPQAVRNVISGSSIIRCKHAKMGEPWDLESEVRNHENRSLSNWASLWKQFLNSALDVPHGGWRAIRKKYEIFDSGPVTDFPLSESEHILGRILGF